MKKIIFPIFVILFITSCGSNSGPQNLDYNFKQGTGQLNVKLVPNAPPELLYPDSEFKFIIELDNQAAYDITDGTIQILGLDPKYFFITPTSESFPNLVGRSLTAPSGEKVYLDDFNGKAGRLFSGAERYVGSYFLVADYSSKVEFSDTICINPNFYEVYSSGCNVKTHSTYSGQGAPLSISSLDEIITPGSSANVELRFLIRNSGTGIAKTVNFISARVGNEQLVCKFFGSKTPVTAQFTPQEQEATLICKKPLRETNAYTTTLFLELGYSYEQRDQYQLELTDKPRTRMFS